MIKAQFGSYMVVMLTHSIKMCGGDLLSCLRTDIREIGSNSSCVWFFLSQSIEYCASLIPTALEAKAGGWQVELGSLVTQRLEIHTAQCGGSGFNLQCLFRSF